MYIKIYLQPEWLSIYLYLYITLQLHSESLRFITASKFEMVLYGVVDRITIISINFIIGYFLNVIYIVLFTEYTYVWLKE